MLLHGQARPFQRMVPCMDTDASSPLGEQLVFAAMNSDVPTVTRLLSEGAPPAYASEKNDSLMTALMWSASEGSGPIAKALIEAGAAPNERNSENFTALIYAFENMPTSRPRKAPPAGFPQLNRKAPPPPQMMIVPRVTGHSDVAKILLSAGADPTVRNAFGETLLHLVARKSRTEWVDDLVSAGVDINALSVGYWETVMHVAAKEGHGEMLTKLVASGANVDAQSRFGWTPLIWAAACGWIDAVDKLLGVDADPNLKAEGRDDIEGTSALREARKCANPIEVSRLLIRAGAIN